MLNISKIYKTGQASLIKGMADQEATKAGTLRVGNTGMMAKDGSVIGPCAALTYLRFKGIDVKGLEDDGDSDGAVGRELMFEAGRANEDLWYNVLKAGWPKGVILRESEIATHWKTSQGIDVTGRPDMVLCEHEFNLLDLKRAIVPKIGIELKQIASVWTAYEVKFKGQPKHNHLLQAAHYAWQLGVPFELWYTNRTDYHIPDWIKSQFPQPGSENSEALAYTYYRLNGDKSRSKVSKYEWEQLPVKGRQADPLKITQFIQGYRLEIKGDTLHYKDIQAGSEAEWIETNVHISDIMNYFEQVSQLQSVPPEPLVVKADGTRANYKARDYCPAGKNCCAYTAGQPIKVWADTILRELEK